MRSMAGVLNIVLAVLVVYLAVRLYSVRRSIPQHVDDALHQFKKRSERVRVGHTVEQLVPFVQEFPYDPSDARIISGGPVDYVIFDGLCDGEIRELVFLDVKTGKARTNRAQKQVERCAELRQVRFEVFEVDAERGARIKPVKRSRSA